MQHDLFIHATICLYMTNCALLLLLDLKCSQDREHLPHKLWLFQLATTGNFANIAYLISQGASLPGSHRTTISKSLDFLAIPHLPLLVDFVPFAVPDWPSCHNVTATTA